MLVNWFGTAAYFTALLAHRPADFFLVAGIIIVWQSVPFVAFTVYAGLTQVPDEVLEAAQLDGARRVQALPADHLPVSPARSS